MAKVRKYAIACKAGLSFTLKKGILDLRIMCGCGTLLELISGGEINVALEPGVETSCDPLALKRGADADSHVRSQGYLGSNKNAVWLYFL